MNGSRLFRGPALAAALVSVLAAVPAQDPPTFSSPYAGLRTVLGQSSALTDAGGELVGVGAGYHARFRAGAVEFVPALGAEVPRSRPLTLRIGRIFRADGTPAVAAAAVRPSRSGQTVSYGRGPGIVERFEVRPEGVAWSVVFDAPPRGRGDLVVHTTVETDLAYTPGARGGARFVAADGGGVSVGTVTGIDANGDRVGGQIRFADGALELRLPEAFVDHAAYPLVLDPLIGPEFAVSTGSADHEPDVAYDAATDTYLVVWRRSLSAADTDILATRLTGSGGALGATIWLERSTAVAVRPVAAEAAPGRFLVAWQQGSSLLGPWDIQCRAVDAATGTLSAVVPVTATTSIEQDLVMAGDPSSSNVGLVWVASDQRGFVGLRSCAVTVNPTGDPIPNTIRVLTTSPEARRPAFAWPMVIWRDVLTSPVSLAVKGTFVDGAMSPYSSFLVTTSGSNDFGHTSLDVDASTGSALVVYEQFEFAGSGPRDLACHRLTPFFSGLLVGAPQALATTPGVDEAQPAIGWAGGKYLVVWSAGSNLDYDIYGAELGSACEVCGQSFSMTGVTPTRTERTPALAMKWRAGGSSREGLIVFSDTAVGPPQGSIVAARFNAMVGGAVVPVGTACGSQVGTVSTRGPFAIGNPDFQFVLTGAGGTLAAAILGDPVRRELLCGSCALIDPVVSTAVALVLGNASFTLQVPCDPRLVGGGIALQWWTVGGPRSSCSVLGLAASERLHCTVGY